MMRYVSRSEAQRMTEVSPYDAGQAFIEMHLRFRRLIDDSMTATGLSLSRAKVLREISEHGPLNQSALAGRLGFAPRSVTDTIDSLERDGFAERTVDPSDRRARIVAITPDGTDALKAALTAKYAAFDEIFGSLDAPARAQLVDLLRTIDRSLPTPAQRSSPPDNIGECLV